MLHTNMRCVLSELMLHTKMGNVKINVTHEYEMCSTRTYVTYENIIICPNVCYTRMGDYFLFNLMLHMQICNDRTYMYVTHEYDMFSVRTYVTYENIICPNLCYTRKYDV